MPRSTPTARDLELAVEQLQKQRQVHLDALAQIDSVFERYGIAPQGGGGRVGRPRRGRPPGSTSKKTGKRGRGRPRGRRSGGETGPASVLNFVGKSGSKGATSSEIVEHWKSESRAGLPYRTIGMLVEEGKLKRHPLPGERGSRYTTT